jgi:hypothetical protein
LEQRKAIKVRLTSLAPLLDSRPFLVRSYLNLDLNQILMCCPGIVVAGS